MIDSNRSSRWSRAPRAGRRAGAYLSLAGSAEGKPDVDAVAIASHREAPKRFRGRAASRAALQVEDATVTRADEPAGARQGPDGATAVGASPVDRAYPIVAFRDAGDPHVELTISSWNFHRQDIVHREAGRAVDPVPLHIGRLRIERFAGPRRSLLTVGLRRRVALRQPSDERGSGDAETIEETPPRHAIAV